MTKSSPISYTPTEGLCYNPSESIYWVPDLLQKEITRVFEICHGCRLCFKYCDSFPDLFGFIDNNHDGDVTKLTSNEIEHVMNQCFQCKLCEVQCPYTPRDNHEYQLDFPKLVHRYYAQRFRKKGNRLRDRFLSRPDLVGRLARMSLGLVNRLNRKSLHRLFLHYTIGIHKDKKLPSFSNQTFDKWAKVNGKMKTAEEAEVVLFQTCYVQNNDVNLGLDIVEVLEKNQVKVSCIEGFRCCGMPAWETGDLEELRKNAHHNLNLLKEYLDSGVKILAINPTCSMMMRKEYIELLDERDRAYAVKLSQLICDPAEFLWSLRKEPRFNTDFQSFPGEYVAYHAPCHLRAQSVGFPGRDLIKKIPGVKVKMVMNCCGHDGTFAMKKESYDTSIKIGKKSFTEMNQIQASIWATDCPLAALQFGQHTETLPMHPLSILARAYRRDGFYQKIPEKEGSV